MNEYDYMIRQIESSLVIVSVLGFAVFLFIVYIVISIWYNIRCTKINTDEMLKMQIIDFKNKYPDVNIKDEESELEWIFEEEGWFNKLPPKPKNDKPITQRNDVDAEPKEKWWNKKIF